MRSSKEEMCQLAAELFAVVCIECQDTSIHLVTVINDLLADTHSKVCSCAVCYCSGSLSFQLLCLQKV